MVQPAIHVQGMKEARAALAKLDASLVDVIAAGNKKAAQFVVAESTKKAGSLGPQTSKAAKQLTATGTAKAGRVKLANSKGVPYAIGMEFGANHNVPRPMRRRGKGYVMRGWNNLPTRTKTGRFLWPTIQGKRAQILEIYHEEVDRLVKKLNL